MANTTTNRWQKSVQRHFMRKLRAWIRKGSSTSKATSRKRGTKKYASWL